MPFWSMKVIARGMCSMNALVLEFVIMTEVLKDYT